MKRRAVVVLVLFAAAILGLYWWSVGTVSKAAYQPGQRLTPQEQVFVQKAHDLLGWGITLDQNAIDISHLDSVKDFARKDLTEQRKLLQSLKDAVSASDPSFVFAPAESVESRKLHPGTAFNRRYLENIIQIQEQARSTLDHVPGIRDNPPLNRFLNMWAPSINARLSQARALLEKID